jgi:hypothetical protein
MKCVIEKLLIKHFCVSFYTPVGAIAKVSEWMSLQKVNQSTDDDCKLPTNIQGKFFILNNLVHN